MPQRALKTHRLGREIALALTFKVVLLTALWWAVFRPQPGHVKPDAADIFGGPVLSDHAAFDHAKGESP